MVCRHQHPQAGRRGAWSVLLVATCLLVPAVAQGQVPADAPTDTTHTLTSDQELEFFLVAAQRQPLVLAHGALVPGSFQLTVDGRPWHEGQDYRLRSRSGVVVPLRPWAESGQVVATARYRFQTGVDVPHVGWRRMAPAPPPVSADGATARPDQPPTEWDLDAGGDLNVRGSKSVYVSSGSNRELTVDQNLRLNVSGQLTRDIAVRAALTDDNLPVVPEGNTEELQDIDKVLVELTATRWSATLGDFVAHRTGSLFGEYRRKLQGFSFMARPEVGEVEGLFGSPRGRYSTIELQGEDANQGPYFLSGGESGQNLFIVAGSERVTVDGERLTRGQDRDYVIDYVRGTVTFTYRRLITAESLIVVEFEEGEGPYARSVVGGGGAGRLGPVTLRARITRESDDPSRRRSGELDADDEAVLAAAGDDELLAVAPGAVQVEAGLGNYVQVGTGDDLHYEYAAEEADWQVEFFFAGAGRGDYRLSSLTETGVRVFEWVGMGDGNYRVGRQLPLPGEQSLLTLTADLGDTSGVRVHGEWHASSLDQNILSDDDDGDNAGRAGHLSFESGNLGLAGGALSLRAGYEDRAAAFRPFTVAKTIHDYEGWGLGERARREDFLNEHDRELAGGVAWRTGQGNRRLSLDVEAGRLDHGEGLSADRTTVKGAWAWRGAQARHTWREATSQDAVDPLDVWRREQDHELSWRLGPVVPRTGFRERTWRDDADTTGAGRGYRLEEVSAGLGSAPGAAWSWTGLFTHGIADSLRGTQWQHERDSRTWRASLTTPRLLGMRMVADGTVRQVERPGGQEESTRLARVDLSGSWANLGSTWNLGYAVDNSRTEVLARQVVFAGFGEGRYDQAGNFVGENRGDYEVILAGTDSLVATTTVKADLNWQQDMSVLGRDRLWTAWSSRTQLGVEARSLSDDMGRLLTLDPGLVFDDETAVLGRVDLTEEITLLRHLQTWDLRWRFDFRQARDRQYAQGREDRLERTHLVTVTWNPLPRLSLRLRGEHDSEERDTDAELNPTLLAYDALTRRLEGEGSWRPGPGSRLALSIETLTRDDARSGVTQDELALKPSSRWRVGERWSFNAELRLADVQSDEPTGAVRPYFFPTPGTNVEATSRLAWDPSRTLSFALAYFGRKPGGQEWQHDLRLKSTARF